MDENSPEITFRVIQLNDRNRVGPTAITPELAKRAAAAVDLDSPRGLERTEWIATPDRMKAHRTILIEVESKPGEWMLGA